MAHDPFPAPHRRFRRPLASLLALAAFAAGALWATSDVYFGTWSLERPARPRVIETAGTMARVSWQPVTYSDHYEVAVSEGFRTVATIRVDTTEAQLPHLRPGTEYEVRVAAVDERAPKADVTSRRSEAATVRTLRRGSPALLEPTAVTVAEARNTSLSIGWEPVETARQYEVQLASDSRFLAPSTTRSSGRRAVLTGLDADMRYFVRVRAVGAGGATSDWTARLSARTILATDPLPLAVATYNVKCHSCGGPSWKGRRSGVASTIASRGLDVVGLQEAQQSGGPQFLTLVRALNTIQPGWRLTSSKVRGTLGVRIIYNSNTVKLLDGGGVRYRFQGNTSRYHQRYYTWGLFQQRSSGKRFYFFNTHIDPDSLTARVAQGRELGEAVRRMRGPLPAVVVGDFNASQFKVYEVHEAMTDAGLIDPLGVREDSYRIGRGARAERRIHTHFDSFNGFDDRPRKSTGKNKNGKYIDYIFVTPMRVVEFENVVNLDSAGRYRRAASDHNMLRAIVGLP